VLTARSRDVSFHPDSKIGNYTPDLNKNTHSNDGSPNSQQNYMYMLYAHRIGVADFKYGMFHGNKKTSAEKSLAVPHRQPTNKRGDMRVE
jgi:hypothetical protein